MVFIFNLYFYSNLNHILEYCQLTALIKNCELNMNNTKIPTHNDHLGSPTGNPRSAFEVMVRPSVLITEGELLA